MVSKWFALPERPTREPATVQAAPKAVWLISFSRRRVNTNPTLCGGKWGTYVFKFQLRRPCRVGLNRAESCGH